MVVWRYTLNEEGMSNSFDIPEGARILPTVKYTSGGVRIYALVNPEAPLVTRDFVAVGNNESLPVEDPDAAAYVGTFKVAGGVTMHVFELVGAPVA